ncbi:hypothetical protein JTE90_002723 [Oedothorax gibbosus]|uniref:Cuticle protein n=1 Tax=Oedothorax gibbosus TaxID=931172 RepID=A0AAV6VZA2_9ARAC|nr:hypothetical protein JTE90_002723 [Oedothorax gibbosus]
MVPMILGLVGLILSPTLVISQENVEHREFQYNSLVDPSTGRYNFAYDTGNNNGDDVAHSMHMQYADADGMVRGRYGYTDPNGKLRVVEYEAGPQGFIARGDVGPDQFPHGQAPAPASDDPPQQVLSSYNAVANGDVHLDPAPIQMAGWDPEFDGMAQPPANAGSDHQVPANSLESENDDRDMPVTLNVTTGDALEVYGPELGFYRDRYPRIVHSPINDNSGVTPDTTSTPTTPIPASDPTQENPDQNIHNIDVDPDAIRQAAGSPIRRSAEDQRTIVRRSGSSGSPVVGVPASYRRYYARYYHDHDNERRYYPRQSHDHDAEVRSRQTHDHDAELARYRARQAYEAQVRSRQTHDHDAENHRNHNHATYYRRQAAARTDGRYNYPRRIFYRDSHSMEPHEHSDNPVYRNYRDHQHADRHLYGRYRNDIYPATARSRQLQYIPADKYHDKRYYWTYD